MLNPRERRLLAIVLLTLGGYLAYGAVQWLVLQPLQERRQRLQALQATIQRKKLQRRQVLAQQEQLLRWQRASLPADPRQAQSLYHEFLLRMVNDVGLEDPSVNTMPPAPQGGAIVRFPFTIRGRGTLETLVKLLRYFYSVDVLHQIRQLSVRRRGEGQTLEIELRIEALALDGADEERQQIEPDGSSDRLADLEPQEIRRIVERNIFMPYQPPAPPATANEEPAEPVIDPKAFVYFVGCVAVGPECEAWLYDRLSNRLYRLRAGDSVELAGFQARLVDVGEDGLILEKDGKRYRMELGQSLAQIKPLEPPAAPQAQSQAAALLPARSPADNRVDVPVPRHQER